MCKKICKFLQKFKLQKLVQWLFHTELYSKCFTSSVVDLLSYTFLRKLCILAVDTHGSLVSMNPYSNREWRRMASIWNTYAIDNLQRGVWKYANLFYPRKQSPMPKSQPMADVSFLMVVWMLSLQCGQSILTGSGPKLIGTAAKIPGAPGSVRTLLWL